MMKFNIPPYVGTEEKYMHQAICSRKICGDGAFTKKCNAWIEENTHAGMALLTTSCTHALEMAALMAEIKEGDEVILPSYTFVSTANAFAMRGARLVFVDIRPDTLNIDEKLIEAAVTNRTKAIVPVHYAGVGCEMDAILDIASAYRLVVIEDAAQGVMASYKGRALGTMGDFGCFSFHETKNYSMGEGGATLIRDEKHHEAAEIIREKGTDRSRFWRGQVDKYTWIDLGSSYLPSDMNAAYLYAQLEKAEEINADRHKSWSLYFEGLKPLQDEGVIELPAVPKECGHNAHMFYIKTKDMDERKALIAHLKEADIMAVFHYVPLHSSPAGRRFGRFHGEDRHTTAESERLLRLPMYYGLEGKDVERVVESVKRFYAKR